MELIKENREKHRAVFLKNETTIHKIWYNKDFAWADNHVYELEKVNPGYALQFDYDIDHAWIDFKRVEGVPASNFQHTESFIKMIHNFCHDHYKKTQPYAHGDWVLSNIMIDDQYNIEMVDWDNLQVREPEDVCAKIYSDLKSAFGDRYDEVLRSMA
jgi:aminoglycoside phosphotransferase